ncbi:MAG TPA: DUF3054 domain-containing protein [Ktedonobacteraceae bacterium]|nr:DUF3054 domain-containing protein [Ktedonobacteraceae bacterium]
MPKIRETKNQINTGGAPVAQKNPYELKPMSPRRRVITLVIGDIFVFLVFASIGQNSHGEALSIPGIISVALPFALGWFLVAPFVGAFRGDIVSNPRRMANRTIQAWFLSWPVAMLLRWLIVDRTRNTSLTGFITFAFVVLTVNIVLLLLWRWPFAFNNSIRERERQKRESA